MRGAAVTARHRLLAWLLGGASLLVAGCRLDSRLLYFPQPHSVDDWRAIADRTGAQPIEIERDGVVLRGWFLPPANATRASRHPVVIYFGGNAEETSWMLAEARRLPGYAFVAVNYRGYGASGGRPHERALYDDALAVYDRTAARPDVDPARVVVWGRSLGSGVATWVAVRRPVAAVVLTSPYDSIDALARTHYPALAGLLTQPFDSLSRAPGIRAPLLAIVGGRDTVVPPGHSERLAAAWAGPVELRRLPAADHNSLQAYPEYWQSVADFVAGAVPTPSGSAPGGARILHTR